MESQVHGFVFLCYNCVIYHPFCRRFLCFYIFRGARQPHINQSLAHWHKLFLCDEYGAYFSLGC